MPEKTKQKNNKPLETEQKNSEEPAGNNATNLVSDQTPKKKKRSLGCIILLILFILFLLYRTAVFFAMRSHKNPDDSISLIEDALKSSLEKEKAAQEETNPKTAGNSTAGTSSNQTSTNSSATTAPQSQPAQEPTTAPTSSFDTLEFFAEVATRYETYTGHTKRWNKNPVYIGGKESDFSPLHSNCLNQFIEGFNSSSNNVKLVRNAELADIKIYWVTQEEMNTIHNPSGQRPFATWNVNDSGEIYEAEIFMVKDTTDVEDLRCYTMKHEPMHAVGFSHSDQTSYSLMGMPTVGKNLTNNLTDVDKRAIQMLYSSGLPLKQTADQIREYFKTHSY